jgi:DNA replication protein DnaC
MWVASAELAVLSSFTEADRVWFERMGDAGFLVLDDFGAEAMHDHAKQRMERLIDLRYGSGRPTILTSNCDEEEFKARAGNRVVDRFREAGRVVQCGDVSMRRKS